MNMDDALKTFFAEADELLSYMESALLRVEGDSTDGETLNEIFRAAHTIKGSAGLFGLHAIVGFTHVVENLLDRARSGQILIDQDLQGILLHCRDHIALLVADQASGRETTSETFQKGDALLAQLMPWIEAKPSAGPMQGEVVAEESADETSNEPWLVTFWLSSDVLQNGMDPISILRFIGTIGEVVRVSVLEDNLPEDAESFDPELLYLGFEIELITDADRAAIEEAFGFVQDNSDIRILAPGNKVKSYVNTIRSLPETEQRLGQILLKSGALSQNALDRALDEQTVQSALEKSPKMLGEILTEKKVVNTTIVEAALDKQKKFSEQRAGQESHFIRVDSVKLDNLINLIGELVISRQRLDLLTANVGNEPLLDAVANLGGFTEQIRDAALTLRMVQIGDTFQRFRRLVRDTATELGKSIELVIRGAETELDRSMVEKLTDPLTHIVRNAIDHGIEPASVRREKGKPETGKLCLSAYHESGIVVIEISDDGGGINTEKIRAKAIANGVIDQNMKVSESELRHMIFHPGLSTAEKVTDLSGRGVGMDVVKRNVDALQGSIDVESTLGAGTLLRIRLPLTLAIIDGFHVISRFSHFIIPQNTVLECMDLASLQQVDGRNCVNLRGEQIPFVRLSQIFALPEKNELMEEEREKLVVVQFGENRAGIVVEDLYGEVQTVVKPLSPIFQALQGIGGSSLLGSGEIAFILDVPQLIELAVKRESRRNRGKSAQPVRER